jgi:hypothetical protein
MEMIGGVLWGKLADMTNYKFLWTVSLCRDLCALLTRNPAEKIGFAVYFAAVGVACVYKLNLPQYASIQKYLPCQCCFYECSVVFVF